MIPLMKFKDRIVQFIERFEIYVMAAYRFVVGYLAFYLIIQNLPYMEALSMYPVAILLALLCCFLPSGVMLFAAVVLILLELYSLSEILALVVLLIFLIMFCAYMRFTSRKGMYAMLTPIMSMLGVPYTMPVASGLLGEPHAVITVICGEFTYFILRNVTVNFALYVVTDESSAASASSVISFVVSNLLLDQEMYLYLIGFAAAAIVTFCICKLPVRQSHLIAAAIGIVTQIAIIGGGEVMMGNQAQLTNILIGCIVSFLILMIICFFTHSLNYKRMERVQFEDDDYYYYVTAIPKSFALKKNKTARKPASYRNSRVLTDEADRQEEDDDLLYIPDLDASPEGTAAGEVSHETVSRKKNRKKSTSRSGEPLEPETSWDLDEPKKTTPQLAAEAQEKAAEAQAAERAAAAAVAEQAAAAAQAISEAAGQYAPDGSTANETKKSE